MGKHLPYNNGSSMTSASVTLTKATTQNEASHKMSQIANLLKD